MLIRKKCPESSLDGPHGAVCQAAQEKPDLPQPAGSPLEGREELLPPTLILVLDSTFLTSGLLQSSHMTADISVDDTIVSNSAPQSLQTNS